MDTEAHDPIDAMLREAGGRLRATAPTEAATDAALDTLDGRGRGIRRIRWVVPTTIVTAAAAVVAGVLVLGGGTDDAVVRVPAESPTVSTVSTVADEATTVPSPGTTLAPTGTAAPTSAPATAEATPPPPTTLPAAPPPTTTATTAAPTTTVTPTTQPPGAAFVGDLSVEASAGVLGCPGTLGEIADAVTPAGWPIARVACAGDFAVVSAAIDELLQRDATGWTVVDEGDPLGCDGVAAPACAVFGVDELSDVPLPLPPATVVDDPNYLAGEDATGSVRALGATGSDPASFARAVADGLAATLPGDPVPLVEPAVREELPVITVNVRGIPDDSSSTVLYVVEWFEVDGRLEAFRAVSFARCNRGGGHESGLCV